MSRLPTRRTLDKLLDRRNEHPEQLTDIDGQIRTLFEHELAVLVLDMCGFSRLTIKHGIVHYLALIRRMQAVVLPLLKKHQGQLVKTEADNVFAVFDTVPNALAAALEIQRVLEEQNRIMPADWDVNVGIGIGFGSVLLIAETDLFGSEMNLASKLGEDLAQAGEVLLTEAAWARAGQRKRVLKARRARLSGMSLRYYGLPRRK